MAMPLTAEGQGRLRCYWWRKGTMLVNDLTHIDIDYLMGELELKQASGEASTEVIKER